MVFSEASGSPQQGRPDRMLENCGSSVSSITLKSPVSLEVSGLAGNLSCWLLKLLFPTCQTCLWPKMPMAGQWRHLERILRSAQAVHSKPPVVLSKQEA